jgi:uncharacterized protein YcsI (UPF0317 family)
MNRPLPDVSFGGDAGRQVRRAAREGRITTQTSGLAPGLVQGNLVVLQQNLADDFLRFCQANPKPCPVLAVGEPGEPVLPTLGDDVNVATDVPRYRVWREGVLVDEPTDIIALWRDDCVAFVLGCSFSFEETLIADGIPLKHLALGCNVPMFRTSTRCIPAGVFSGPLVVSMRPLKPAQAIRAVQITSRFPAVHGAPVHIGLPHLIGIDDLDRPDYGDPVPVEDDELPVFWACGVTPQAALKAAKPALAFTHAPGCMLVTDLLNNNLSVL